ncbi:cubilin-like [Sarcoptes scabiei]|nr:cubilin-like [Sarcoptes scabiei]
MKPPNFLHTIVRVSCIRSHRNECHRFPLFHSTHHLHHRSIIERNKQLIAKNSLQTNLFRRNLSKILTMEQFLIDPKASKLDDDSDDTEKIIVTNKNNNLVDSIDYKRSDFYYRPQMLLSIKKPSIDPKKVLKIIVEGNIGSGKTTFLSIFSKICSVKAGHHLVVPEPVDLWRNVGGVNIFQLLADDPKRWSFTFQSYVQLTMLKIHEMMPSKGNVKIMERSLFSARYCFVENLYQRQLIDDCEYQILDQWFQNSIESVPVDLIIYLRTDPDIVYRRIQERGRPEESKITLEYLRSLNELHDDWLVRKKFPVPVPVVTIDANIPLEKIMPIYQEKTGGILQDHRFI